MKCFSPLYLSLLFLSIHYPTAKSVLSETKFVLEICNHWSRSSRKPFLATGILGKDRLRNFLLKVNKRTEVSYPRSVPIVSATTFRYFWRGSCLFWIENWRQICPSPLFTATVFKVFFFNFWRPEEVDDGQFFIKYHWAYLWLPNSDISPIFNTCWPSPHSGNRAFETGVSRVRFIEFDQSCKVGQYLLIISPK